MPSAEASRVIGATGSEILRIDLWAKEEPGGVYADQTWMASLGEPSSEALEIWNAIRDARDAAIEMVETRIGAGEALRGADVDDAARRVIEARGYGQYFTHRTTGPAIRSILRICMGRGRISTTSRRARSGCLFRAWRFRSSPGFTSRGRLECVRR